MTAPHSGQPSGPPTGPPTGSSTSAATSAGTATPSLSPTQALAGASRLRKLELTILRRLDGLLQGDVQALIPGRGSEPGEARLYSAGDDVRRIDWNVTARSIEPHVRETIADREVEVTLVVDRSASMRFGTALGTKADLAVAGGATVAVLAARNPASRIGAIIATGGASTVVVPPLAGRQALFALLDKLARTNASATAEPVDLVAVLRGVGRTTRRRGLIVVVTDFLAPMDWESALGALAHRHDVLCLEVVDPRELELPAIGPMALADAETGQVRRITITKSIAERYKDAASAQRQRIADSITRTGASHLQLRTDVDWVLQIADFVRRRKRQATRGRKVVTR